MLKGGSLSFGFMSKTLRFVEYGSAVVRSGAFTGLAQTLTRGNIGIKDARTPHVTLHPPRIAQNCGVAHMLDDKGKVDEWDLDWFPVKKPVSILYAYSGDITILEKSAKPKGNRQIVGVPSDVECLLMTLVLNPRSSQVIHYPNIIANVHGFCPDFIVSCYFEKIGLVAPAVFVATEGHLK